MRPQKKSRGLYPQKQVREGSEGGGTRRRGSSWRSPDIRPSPVVAHVLCMDALTAPFSPALERGYRGRGVCMAGHICHVLSALSTENQWGNTSHRVSFSKQSNASLVKDLFTTKMPLFSRKWKVVLGGMYTGQILKQPND